MSEGRRRLERPATIAFEGDAGRRGLVLEGLLLPVAADDPAGGAVIAAPHPLYGGSMDSPVVSELAFACEEAGIPSLRFNWRGVGASAGATSGDSEDAASDYRAALEFLTDSVEGPAVACGYSFGAAAAVRASQGRPHVRRLLLVAPPPALLDTAILSRFPGRVLIAVGENDAIASPRQLEAIAHNLEAAQLEIIPDADHFFMTSLRTLEKVAHAWLCY